MSRKAPRRFYREVGIAERDGAFAVLLDGKPAKTPRGASLQLPSLALAEAIAEEWRAQGEHLAPSNMLLTGLANAAIDRASTQRGQVIEHILAFGRSDLVCYRAEAPASLVERQKETWDPLLAWAWEKYKLRLLSDMGISYIEQPMDAAVRMRELASALDEFLLAAFEPATALTGSFILALALIDGHIGAEQAFAAAQLDELYQAGKWGRDSEAEQRRGRLFAELNAIELFVRLLRDMHHKQQQEHKGGSGLS